MSDQQRATIIASVLNRRNAAGNLEETYVSHVKIWEDSPEGRKPRYILLSEASNGSGFIHKSKMNTNGTFSVGKTWKLADLRAVVVVNPTSFNVTLGRTYRWQTEDATDQANFVEALVRLFKTLTSGAPLHFQGLVNPDLQGGTPTPQSRPARTPSPTSSTSHRTPLNRAHTPSQLNTEHEAYDVKPGKPSPRVPSPLPQNGTRNGGSSRPSSPAAPPLSYASNTYRNGESSRRAPSPASSTGNGVSRAAKPPRRPSHSTSGSSISRPSISISNPSGLRPDPDRTPVRPERRQTEMLAARERRDHNARISFFDTANQALLDRVLSGGEADADDENAQATMASVEEMIEGYEWASEDVIGRKTARGAADLIQARLLDELTALDKANIHSFLETDDRIALVMKLMDDALSELDGLGSQLSSYKIHLNAVSDDISYIQSQNRGLQVQTQNQRALLDELENLLQTVHVADESLVLLTQESLEQSQSIQRLEEAASELYRALLAGREREMAATMERLQDYRTHNAQFCKRVFDFWAIMFTAQGTLLLGDHSGLMTAKGQTRPVIISHQDVEQYLGRYCGLMLYLKEMDEAVYAKVCAAYFSAASELYATQFKALLANYTNLVKKVSDEDGETSFSSPLPTNSLNKSAQSGIRRAGTLIRSDGRRDKDKTPRGVEFTASEVLSFICEQLTPLIAREAEFIADFLHINDQSLTFADYMGLDNYFRRQAARAAGLSLPTLKLVRGAMDLIFGFLPHELKTWIDSALVKDKIQLIGMLMVLERFMIDADERGQQFLQNLWGKQHMRLKVLYDRHVAEQIKAIEAVKLTSKKRRGVVPFVKHFPVYVGRIESQLVGADTMEIRTSVNLAYDRIVQAMFDCLKQMAKLEGEGEDKGQLNYHVILIENMHHFVAETSHIDKSVGDFLQKAELIYEESLAAYVKIVMRRPFAKIIDYFEGVERLLKSISPPDVANNGSYNRSALKKVVKEYNVKDVRKHVDALFKRVEKHFTEASEKTTTEESGGIAPGTVMVGVWQACEEELLRITDLFTKRITQCYPDSGITLEYTTRDVKDAFKRHRM
ncbi:hypothetical protein FISHEDRAFT_48677 [Fistulina hepatica ATCC 64428]|uniref:Exocyst complex component Sec3 PIP2-binding N-terminal domain-containing protein n=1 Tax=Fistulina hepatica ATCC 64428 TaxID=1128425 RepID=A0A0D7A4N2_9AGAR|nr:hypothetical protein FISHEDRAFT_48677 [Fistulina hepatica ATCC 64428]